MAFLSFLSSAGPFFSENKQTHTHTHTQTRSVKSREGWARQDWKGVKKKGEKNTHIEPVLGMYIDEGDPSPFSPFFSFIIPWIYARSKT
jgi:hypothetical protein